MASQEIYSFVEKFHQLWNAGLSAHLDIDTHAGEAWVGLRVKLGNGREHPSEYKQPTSFYSKPETSSRCTITIILTVALLPYSATSSTTGMVK